MTLSTLTKAAAAKIGKLHPAEEICYVESYTYKAVYRDDSANINKKSEKRRTNVHNP
jgi:hypothetical protein